MLSCQGNNAGMCQVGAGDKGWRLSRVTLVPHSAPLGTKGLELQVFPGISSGMGHGFLYPKHSWFSSSGTRHN